MGIVAATGAAVASGAAAVGQVIWTTSMIRVGGVSAARAVVAVRRRAAVAVRAMKARVGVVDRVPSQRRLMTCERSGGDRWARPL